MTGYPLVASERAVGGGVRSRLSCGRASLHTTQAAKTP